LFCTKRVVWGEGESHWKGWALKIKTFLGPEIKLPVYLVFYMALGLNDFDAGKSITRARIGGVGPEISTFFGPK
jgi:hypothetical protein